MQVTAQSSALLLRLSLRRVGKALFYYFLKKQWSRTSSSHLLLLLPLTTNTGAGAVRISRGEPSSQADPRGCCWGLAGGAALRLGKLWLSSHPPPPPPSLRTQAGAASAALRSFLWFSQRFSCGSAWWECSTGAMRPRGALWECRLPGAGAGVLGSSWRSSWQRNPCHQLLVAMHLWPFPPCYPATPW